MLFLPWISAKTSVYSSTAAYNVFKTGIGGSAASFWSVMLVIFAILYILCLLLAVYGILSDRSTLALPLAALAFVMFFFAVFQRAFAMNELTKTAAAAMYSMVGSSAAMYASSMVSSLVQIHVGAGAWLFFFLNLAAVALLLVENRLAGRPLVNTADFSLSGVAVPKVNLPKVNLGGSWNCPNCGAAQGGGQKFCTQCGTPRPEEPRCPGCGKPIKAGAAFCPSCGTKL